MEGSYAVRKGAWSEEEDMLLRQEIEKHGEGNWCKVPLRAGLNRCRKSCRLRWLNYLKPSIKRGAFKEDEVDMIIRPHKLLGNRWSLISGRLPGRTANDVKNFWNTHIRKKEMSHANTTQDIVKVNVIRPKPSTVSKNFTLLHEKSASVKCFEPENSDNVLSPTLTPSENEVQWWERLLYDKEDDEMATGGPAEELGRVPMSGEKVPKAKVDTSDEGGPNCFPDFSFDMIDWDFLDADYESMTL